MKNILNISFGAWENEVYKKNTFYIPELAKKKKILSKIYYLISPVLRNVKKKKKNLYIIISQIGKSTGKIYFYG